MPKKTLFPVLWHHDRYRGVIGEWRLCFQEGPQERPMIPPAEPPNRPEPEAPLDTESELKRNLENIAELRERLETFQRSARLVMERRRVCAQERRALLSLPPRSRPLRVQSDAEAQCAVAELHMTQTAEAVVRAPLRSSFFVAPALQPLAEELEKSGFYMNAQFSGGGSIPAGDADGDLIILQILPRDAGANTGLVQRYREQERTDDAAALQEVVDYLSSGPEWRFLQYKERIQCHFEGRTMDQPHGSGIRRVETDPPAADIHEMEWAYNALLSTNGAQAERVLDEARASFLRMGVVLEEDLGMGTREQNATHARIGQCRLDDGGAQWEKRAANRWESPQHPDTPWTDVQMNERTTHIFNIYRYLRMRVLRVSVNRAEFPASAAPIGERRLDDEGRTWIKGSEGWSTPAQSGLTWSDTLIESRTHQILNFNIAAFRERNPARSAPYDQRRIDDQGRVWHHRPPHWCLSTHFSTRWTADEMDAHTEQIVGHQPMLPVHLVSRRMDFPASAAPEGQQRTDEHGQIWTKRGPNEWRTDRRPDEIFTDEAIDASGTAILNLEGSRRINLDDNGGRNEIEEELARYREQEWNAGNRLEELAPRGPIFWRSRGFTVLRNRYRARVLTEGSRENPQMIYETAHSSGTTMRWRFRSFETEGRSDGTWEFWSKGRGRWESIRVLQGEDIVEKEDGEDILAFSRRATLFAASASGRPILQFFNGIRSEVSEAYDPDSNRRSSLHFSQYTSRIDDSHLSTFFDARNLGEPRLTFRFRLQRLTQRLERGYHYSEPEVQFLVDELARLYQTANPALRRDLDTQRDNLRTRIESAGYVLRQIRLEEAGGRRERFSLVLEQRDDLPEESPILATFARTSAMVACRDAYARQHDFLEENPLGTRVPYTEEQEAGLTACNAAVARAESALFQLYADVPAGIPREIFRMQFSRIMAQAGYQISEIRPLPPAEIPENREQEGEEAAPPMRGIIYCAFSRDLLRRAQRQRRVPTL